MSFNQVSSLSALSPLLAVTQLNCEGNCIASLAALTGLSSLVELYAAHNSLQHIKVWLDCSAEGVEAGGWSVQF